MRKIDGILNDHKKKVLKRVSLNPSLQVWKWGKWNFYSPRDYLVCFRYRVCTIVKARVGYFCLVHLHSSYVHPCACVYEREVCKVCKRLITKAAIQILSSWSTWKSVPILFSVWKKTTAHWKLVWLLPLEGFHFLHSFPLLANCPIVSHCSVRPKEQHKFFSREDPLPSWIESKALLLSLVLCCRLVEGTGFILIYLIVRSVCVCYTGS